MVKQMKERKGITGQSKTESPWKWISLMNNIAACTREDVNAEIILA
ncbi:MAG: TnpV protein [Clostridiales bacterium]|nr:TnpV protein [Clostridiales bacterium]